MLKPKKGYENSQITFRVGAAQITMPVKDITEEIVHKYRHHLDLNEYVESLEPTQYEPEKHDVETVLQDYLDLQESKPKKQRKKKNG